MDTVAAFHRISNKIKHTPLLNSEILDRQFGKGYKIFFKCENFQATRSYKPRGALNALMKKAGKPVVARSSGNFGQAMAWAGAQLNIPITIVMPSNAPKVKIEGTKSWGANVVMAGNSYQEQYAKVDELLAAMETGVSIHAFNDLDVIEGQGTVALEIVKEKADFKHFFAPVGGGGLMGGCAAYLKGVDSGYEVIAIEPKGADDFTQSLKAGKIVRLEKAETIADGLRSPAVGDLNWPLLKRHVDSSLAVSEEAICQAMKRLFETLGIVVEPSGAVSFSALLDNPGWQPRGDMVFVISGGNVDPSQFLDIISSTLADYPTIC